MRCAAVKYGAVAGARATFFVGLWEMGQWNLTHEAFGHAPAAMRTVRNLPIPNQVAGVRVHTRSDTSSMLQRPAAIVGACACVLVFL